MDQNHGDKMFIYLCLGIWAASVFATIALFFFSIPLSLVFLVIALFCGYPVFKGTMNKLQAVGRLYWITRDYCTPNTPFFSKGFMRELDAPWRHGRGLQIRFGSYTFQVGLCRPQEHDEVSGVLAAMDGRFLELEPKEIGKWK